MKAVIVGKRLRVARSLPYRLATRPSLPRRSLARRVPSNRPLPRWTIRLYRPNLPKTTELKWLDHRPIGTHLIRNANACGKMTNVCAQARLIRIRRLSVRECLGVFHGTSGQQSFRGARRRERAAAPTAIRDFQERPPPKTTAVWTKMGECGSMEFL